MCGFGERAPGVYGVITEEYVDADISIKQGRAPASAQNVSVNKRSGWIQAGAKHGGPSGDKGSGALMPFKRLFNIPGSARHPG